MHINQLRKKRFLTKADVGTGILGTIAGLEQHDVSGLGEPPDVRWAIRFEEEHLKPFILNSSNGKLLAQIFGSEETDDWVGKKIVLFEDPSIEFKGKRVGGIRIRQPRTKANPAVNTIREPEVLGDAAEVGEIDEDLNF